MIYRCLFMRYPVTASLRSVREPTVRAPTTYSSATPSRCATSARPMVRAPQPPDLACVHSYRHTHAHPHSPTLLVLVLTCCRVAATRDALFVVSPSASRHPGARGRAGRVAAQGHRAQPLGPPVQQTHGRYGQPATRRLDLLVPLYQVCATPQGIHHPGAHTWSLSAIAFSLALSHALSRRQ